MKIIVKYWLHDGVDEYKVIGDEQEWSCIVKTFSDYHDLFSIHILTNIPDHLYVNIKSVKVIDIP